MASSYSTDLKLELMVTGEKAGLWGDITNTNLVILQQAIAGYQQVGVTSGATLAFTNGVLSNGKNSVVDMTGTIAGNVNVTIPDGIEKNYILKNSTTGAYNVVFKTTSGSGATFKSTDKGTKIVYSNGTDVIDVFANQKEIGLFTIPSSDGTNQQAIVTDGSGTLSFAGPYATTGKAIAMAMVFG